MPGTNFHVLAVLIAVLKVSTTATAYPYTPLHYGEFCDWRGPPDPCDAERGLACSYLTNTCACWDPRKTYSKITHRCVGKAGDECSYYESQRLCTPNAYCLEDSTLSPIPICMCLKGYFRSDTGACVKYSMHGESCEPFPRQACEAESGLKCIHFKCQCEPDQIYDSNLRLCLAKANAKCSKTLNNCIPNAECSEKLWEFDHKSGETKISGYRCTCKPGLKITEDGMCAADFAGPCEKSSDCFQGENLTCLNGVCQCYPYSQIYDKLSRRCFNLVGTKCQSQSQAQAQANGGNGNENENLKSKSRTNSKRSSISTTTTSTTTATATAISTTTTSGSGSGPDSQNSNSFVDVLTGSCIPNAECINSECQCINGSSETLMRTCLLDYGQDCHNLKSRSSSWSDEKNSINYITPTSTSLSLLVSEKEMKCNVFEGLICHSDEGKCLCADPSLVFDEEAKSCVSSLGNPCGNLRLDMLDLKDEFKQMIFINCQSNSTCLERNVGGMSKRICVSVPMGVGASGTSLSKIMLNNANVITDTE